MAKDRACQKVCLTERVAKLREDYFGAVPEICVERPKLITQFSLRHNFLSQERISILEKAKTYRHVLESRKAIVRHSRACEKNRHDGKLKNFELDKRFLSLFAGSTTSKFKGVPLYPEFQALTLWPELWTVSSRASNPYYLAEDDVRMLNHEVFPHWMKHNVLELARKRCFDENLAKSKKQRHAPEMKLFERLVFFLASKPNCISHTIPDFSRAIRLGLRQIINQANDKADSTDDASKKEFYAAISEVLEGIITYSNRLADEADRLAQDESDPELKKELLDMAAVNRRVPEHPAQSFREGLTTVWICWIAIHLENPNVGLSLGRLDQVLHELYQQDIDKGTMTEEDAVELLCCLWLKIGDHVPTVPEAGEQLFGGTGSNQAITIGGVDKDGKDAVNDLTYVMLKATEMMMLRDPNLNARYHAGVNSESYLRRLCEVNIDTRATPALHNDKAVIAALTAKGETLKQARDYGVVGCVEPGSNGRTYGHTASILLNLTSVLELTLYGGRHRHTGMNLRINEETDDLTGFESFGEFRDAFAKQVRWMAEQTTRLNNILGQIHQDFYPTPILSALFEGPMEKGKDLIQGGAAVNFSGVAIIGLADVADSLSAIQKVVFEDGDTSLAELLKAMESNFESNELLHKRLMDPERTPKYGNEDAIADENVAWLVELLDREFGGKQNYRGGHYRVGYWTMTNHAGYGRLTRALPSGRKDYENFTSGITPVSGVTPSLAKALNSVSKLPAQCLSNGVALNLKFTPESEREKMIDKFIGYVKGYFDCSDGQSDGGMEIQFNITTRDTFVDAAKHPEKYPELLVRVSGYTAYFKDLNPRMQKEIIDRTEYQLLPGRALPHDPFPLKKETP